MGTGSALSPPSFSSFPTFFLEKKTALHTPRWNFGSTFHYSVTEQLCWREKGSPCFTRISHGNFTGTPGPLRYAEHHRVGDKGIHRTGESRRRPGRSAGWEAGCSQAAVLEWNPVAQAWENQGGGKATNWSITWPCSILSDSLSLKKMCCCVLYILGKKEEVVTSNSCSDVLGSRHCICRDSVPPSCVLTTNLSSQGLGTRARSRFCGAWSLNNWRGPPEEKEHIPMTAK